MKLIIYLILGIIGSIFNILPLSYSAHITLFKNLLNTKIFNYSSLNSLFVLPSLIAILLTMTKQLPPKSKNFKKYLKVFFKVLIPLTISLIIHLFFNKDNKLTINNIPIIFLLTAFLLFFTKNKSHNKTLTELNIKNIITLTLLNLLTFINGLPLLIINLLGCYLCKLNKDSSIKYSLTIYAFHLLLDSSAGINYLFLTKDLIPLSISLFISTILSLSLIKYLIKLINNNKLFKLSLYLILIAIFTIFWFR